MKQQTNRRELTKQVVELAKEGLSQRKISKELNITRSEVRKIFRDNNIITKAMYNARVSSMSVEDRAKEFAKRLKQKDNTKEYYSGYIDGDSRVKIKCLKCGSIYEVGANIVRTKHNQIYCQSCASLKAEKKRQKRIAKAEQRNRIKRAKTQLEFSQQLTFKVCEQCGTLFVGDNKYCSRKCGDRIREHKKSRLRIKRAKKNGCVDYTITLDKLIKRDNNICYLCNKECNLLDYTYQGNTFVAGNYYPSIDHVIPLAKGGTHTWNNVRLAHRLCNSIKSDA